MKDAGSSPAKPAGPAVVFIGDSLIEWGRWEWAFPDVNIINMGMCGDTTGGVLMRLGMALALQPVKLFIMIGAGDLAYGIPPEQVLRNQGLILAAASAGSPRTKTYIHSLLPNRNGAWGLALANVHMVNRELPLIAKKFGAVYIDIHEHFTDGGGQLREELSDDGLHLSRQGYELWEGLVKVHVVDKI
jgi:lysophospholipase L1-like esterase